MIYLMLLGLLFVFLGASFMLAISKYPGYVLISVGDYAIEFNIWFFLTAILLTFIVLRFLYRITRYCFSSVGTSYAWIKNSSQIKNTQRTQSGLMHFAEGDWLKAKKELLRSVKKDEHPLLHYVLAAKCAYQLGDVGEAQRLLESAASDKKVPQDNVSIQLTRASILLSEKKFEECLEVLSQLGLAASDNRAYLEMQAKAQFGLGNWSALAELLPQLKDSAVYSKDGYEALRQKVYSSLFSEEMKSSDKSQKMLDTAWQKVPKDLRKQETMLKHYCTALHHADLDELAAPIIQKSLKSNWSSELVELYGRLKLEDVSAQLVTAESWLSKHEEDPYLLSALARICQRNSLWGKAKEYYESSLKIKERPEAYAELAALMMKLGDSQKSHDLYQKGLMLTTA